MKKMLLMVCLAVLAGCGKKNPAQEALLIHVGGTIAPAFKALAKEYTKETGQPVRVNVAGSGELLAHIEMQREGDLFVGHDPFLEIAMQRNLGVDGWTLAEISPVIVVQKGNPKNIQRLEDLTRSDVRLALTDYQRSTLGHMLPTIFGKAGIDLDELTKEKNIIIHRSGSYVANLVAMNSADAALVWDAVWFLRKDKLDRIDIDKYLPVPGVDGVTSATGKRYILTPVKYSMCSLKCSTHPQKVDGFVRFALSEPARALLKDYGFTIHDGIQRKVYRNGKKL